MSEDLPIEDMKNVNWQGLSEDNAVLFGKAAGKFDEALDKYYRVRYLCVHNVVLCLIVLLCWSLLPKVLAVGLIVLLLMIETTFICFFTLVSWINQDIALSKLSDVCKMLPRAKKA